MAKLWLQLISIGLNMNKISTLAAYLLYMTQIWPFYYGKKHSKTSNLPRKVSFQQPEWANRATLRVNLRECMWQASWIRQLRSQLSRGPKVLAAQAWLRLLLMPHKIRPQQARSLTSSRQTRAYSALFTCSMMKMSQKSAYGNLSLQMRNLTNFSLIFDIILTILWQWSWIKQPPLKAWYHTTSQNPQKFTWWSRRLVTSISSCTLSTAATRLPTPLSLLLQLSAWAVTRVAYPSTPCWLSKRLLHPPVHNPALNLNFSCKLTSQKAPKKTKLKLALISDLAAKEFSQTLMTENSPEMESMRNAPQTPSTFN